MILGVSILKPFVVNSGGVVNSSGGVVNSIGVGGRKGDWVI